MPSALEVEAGLVDYRNTLVEAFADNPVQTRVESIRSRLAATGVVSATPVVVIPYTAEALDTASGIAQDSTWIEPFTYQRIESTQDMRRRLDDGESFYDVGFPANFHSPPLNLVVVYDDTNVQTELFGDMYAQSLLTETIAHELTHSSAADLTKMQIRKASGTDTFQLQGTEGICHSAQEQLLRPGGGEIDEYKPVWLEEAFAARMAAHVRVLLHPEAIPKFSFFFEFPEYSIDEILVPPKYLISSSKFPDDPGNSHGNVAGIGLDMLEVKMPGLLDTILELTAGKVAIDAFHAYLVNTVGSDLYTAMVEPRPYTTWGSVLDQIEDLQILTTA